MPIFRQSRRMQLSAWRFFATVLLLIYMGTFRQMAGVAADPVGAIALALALLVVILHLTGAIPTHH